MGKLNSVVCKECGLYSGVYDGLCGNCILLHDKTPEDFDEGLRARRLIREREDREGKFPKTELEIAQLEALDRPKPVIEPGLKPKPTRLGGPPPFPFSKDTSFRIKKDGPQEQREPVDNQVIREPGPDGQPDERL
jgi:hypothetical protein